MAVNGGSEEGRERRVGLLYHDKIQKRVQMCDQRNLYWSVQLYISFADQLIFPRGSNA